MSEKPVSLRVVRNRREREEQRRVHREIVTDAKYVKQRFPECDGYLLVAWDRHGNSISRWENRANAIHTDCIGEFAKRQIERVISQKDAQDLISEPDDPA